MPRKALACFLVLALADVLQPVQAQVRPDGPPPKPLAQERADRLDGLLQRLHAARNETEAEAISKEVRRLWMQSDDADSDVDLEEALIYVRRGLLKPALDTLDRLLSRTPRFAEAWFRRASIYYVMNEPDRAKADLDRAIELEPRHFVALMTRGQLFLERREWKSALGDFRAALRVHPFLQEQRLMLPHLERLAGDRGI